MWHRTPFNWTCPYCSQGQTVVENKCHRVDVQFQTGQYPPMGAVLWAITCSNPDCLSTTVEAMVAPHTEFANTTMIDFQNQLFRRRVLPESGAQRQPEFIPKALRNDYYEACLIRELSPKASATLARRCLQGMIRDFCGITGATLNAEITKLRELVAEDKAPRGVTPESVDAIDHVRRVGNIGAHMEKDIDHIVDVDAGEAQILIELVESLFDEWYVARERRQARFAAVKSVAEAKKAAIEAGKPATALPSPGE